MNFHFSLVLPCFARCSLFLLPPLCSFVQGYIFFSLLYFVHLSCLSYLCHLSHNQHENTVAVAGHVEMELKSGTQSVFKLTVNLDQEADDNTKSSAVHQHDVFQSEPFIRVFTPHAMDPTTRGTGCNNIETGCEHRPRHALKSNILAHTRFRIEPSTEFPMEVFATDLTLSVRSHLLFTIGVLVLLCVVSFVSCRRGGTNSPPNLSLWCSLSFFQIHSAYISKGSALDNILDSSGSESPEMYISFMQFELSEVQTHGVHLIIGGMAVFLFGLALMWARSILQRDTAHKRH